MDPRYQNVFKPMQDSQVSTWGGLGTLFNFCLPGTAPWSGLDPFQRLRNGPGMLLDRFSAQTVDSGPISGHFRCFWPGLKIRSRPNLAWNPQPGLQIAKLFSGPISGFFFCTCFIAFPGNPKIMSTPLTYIISGISWKYKKIM